MRSFNLLLAASLAFLAAASPQATRTTSTPRSIDDGLHYTDNQVIPRTAHSPRIPRTNAERLAAGLSPLAPKRRFQPRQSR